MVVQLRGRPIDLDGESRDREVHRQTEIQTETNRQTDRLQTGRHKDRRVLGDKTHGLTLPPN